MSGTTSQTTTATADLDYKDLEGDPTFFGIPMTALYIIIGVAVVAMIVTYLIKKNSNKKKEQEAAMQQQRRPPMQYGGMPYGGYPQMPPQMQYGGYSQMQYGYPQMQSYGPPPLQQMPSYGGGGIGYRP